MRRLTLRACVPAATAAAVAGGRLHIPTCGPALAAPQRAFYAPTRPTQGGWFSRLFGGGGGGKSTAAADAEDGVVSAHRPESILTLLKDLADDKTSPLAFLARVLKGVMAKMQAQQTMEMQAVVDETNVILATMRERLQALVDKIQQAEDMMQRRFPAGEKPAAMLEEEVNNIIKDAHGPKK